ncbi:PKD domain protein [compost metagenome]
MKYINLTFITLLFFFTLSISKQNTASAQCNTNTSICAPGTAGPFTFVSPGPVVSSCLDFWGPNMGYIVLHITSSGPLNMLINGNSSFGFLDVAVFNIPNGQSPCTAIQNISNQIGCNYATGSGGCNQFGTSFPCSSSVPAPMVTAGQEIMILVENWSGSSSNFTLQLSPTGAQSGSPNATINSAGPFCVTSGSTQLTAADMGGTWSGPGVSPTGMFNPATAGLGTHTINYSIGVAPCNASASTTVTVNNATVTPPAAQTICVGGSTLLTASGAGSYTWSPATGLSSTTGASVTASPATTTTYTVTGTTAGCTSTGTVTVTVAPLTVNVSPNTSICSGASTTLTATGATNYTWSPTTGLSATTGATVTASPATTTTYTVTGTTGSCSATANVTVTVTPVNVSVSPNTSVCSGASTTLTASGATSYSWSPSTGLSASTGASVSANPSATTTYTVTGTTGACSSTATVTVTVTPLALTVSPNTGICNGASTILTAGGATNYSWSPSTGLSSTSGSSVTANPTTTTTYTVSGTTGSCSSSQSVTVTVTPVIVNLSPNTSICNGASTTLTASGGATNYSWSPATGLSSTSGSSVTANPTTTTTYTVTGTVGSCSNTATMTLTVNPIPTVTANNTGPYCEGSTIQLQSGSLPGTTYSWSGPNGYSASTQNASVPATVAAGGMYTVITSLNGCSSTATTDVFVNSTQIPAITQAGPFCTNVPNTVLSADITGGVWSGTGIVNEATGEFSALVAGPGSHQVTYTITGGCSSPGTRIIVVNPMPVVQITTPESTGCVPFVANLFDGSTPSDGTILWNFGDGSTHSSQPDSVTHLFTAAGCYDITVTSTSAAGCATTTSFPSFICTLPRAVAAFYVNDPVHGLMDPEFKTFNTSSNASSYSWDFGDGNTSNLFSPTHTYMENPGNYIITLIANNSSNCPDSAKLTVTLQEELVFYIPNTFTPDGDEFNNTFLPVFTSGFDPFNYSLTIYNRWGETLFESLDPSQGWDGTYNGELCKGDIYNWAIRFKSSSSDKKITKTGHIQILE